MLLFLFASFALHLLFDKKKHRRINLIDATWTCSDSPHLSRNARQSRQRTLDNPIYNRALCRRECRSRDYSARSVNLRNDFHRNRETADDRTLVSPIRGQISPQPKRRRRTLSSHGGGDRPQMSWRSLRIDDKSVEAAKEELRRIN